MKNRRNSGRISRRITTGAMRNRGGAMRKRKTEDAYDGEKTEKIKIIVSILTKIM